MAVAYIFKKVLKNEDLDVCAYPIYPTVLKVGEQETMTRSLAVNAHRCRRGELV